MKLLHFYFYNDLVDRISRTQALRLVSLVFSFFGHLLGLLQQWRLPRAEVDLSSLGIGYRWLSQCLIHKLYVPHVPGRLLLYSLLDTEALLMIQIAWPVAQGQGGVVVVKVVNDEGLGPLAVAVVFHEELVKLLEHISLFSLTDLVTIQFHIEYFLELPINCRHRLLTLDHGVDF